MVISTPLIKAYARLGQKGAAAGIGMLEVAKSDPNLRVVVADSIAIASLDRFMQTTRIRSLMWALPSKI